MHFRQGDLDVTSRGAPAIRRYGYLDTKHATLANVLRLSFLDELSQLPGIDVISVLHWNAI